MFTKKGNFKCLAGDDYHEVSYPYFYDESWFTEESSKAPYELMRFSLCAAMAASREEFITDLFEQLDFKYTNAINYEKENMNVLAGDKITQSVYYPAQTINGVPYYNSIGYAIGSKEVEDATLLFVAIRGGDYGIEWGSNFNIGTGTNFEGFEIATKQVLDGIRYYIEDNKISNKIKVLTMGYSRGAAVANLTAAALNKGAVKNISKEDVYAFCFECPRNTTDKKALEKDYDNIFCVANPDDLVPKLAMSVWGYRRYGKTYFLPAFQLDKDYEKKKKLMLEAAKEIDSENLKPVEKDNYNVSQFVNDLGFATKGPKTFEKIYSPSLQKFAAIFLGGGKERPDEHSIEVLRELEANLIALNPPNAKYMETILGSKPDNIFMINPHSPLLLNHNMELILSWLNSFKDYKDFGLGTVRYIYINNALNAYITTKNNKIVAKLTEGHIQKVEDEIYTKIDENGQYIVIVPTDLEVEIEIINSKNNSFDLSIQEFDMTLGRPTRILNYGPINQSQTGSVNCKIPDSTKKKKYKVVDSKKEKLEPQKDLSKDEIKYLKVTPATEGTGIVTGGGYFTLGEYAQLKAIVNEKEKFSGWFVNNEEVSSELAYRFKVEDDVTVVGKFS